MKLIAAILILFTSVSSFAYDNDDNYDYNVQGYSNPYCSIHNNNPRQCNATPGCRFISGGTGATCNGRPGFPPSQTQYCAIHNNNPQQCNATAWCQYTIPADQCVSL